MARLPVLMLSRILQRPVVGQRGTKTTNTVELGLLPGNRGDAARALLAIWARWVRGLLGPLPTTSAGKCAPSTPQSSPDAQLQQVTAAVLAAQGGGHVHWAADTASPAPSRDKFHIKAREMDREPNGSAGV